MKKFYEKLQIASPVSVVVLSIAIILAAGFLLTRITKLLKLPNVTAYVVAGIIIGPFCLKAVPESVIDGSAFVSDIALAFIAFSAGEFFRFSSFAYCGWAWRSRWCCRRSPPQPRLPPR